MITNGGKTIIKRFFARQVAQIAGSLALGVGTAAPALTDTRVQFEVVRVPVSSINADIDNSRLVFKATLTPGLIGTIYEIGVYPLVQPATMRNLDLTSSLATWTNSTLNATNARAGALAVKIDYVANGTTTAELTGLNEDFSMFNDVDSFAAAYYAGANLSSVSVRMGTDSSNYFAFSLAAPVANSYNVSRLNKSAATKVGTPDWSKITYIAVRPSATAAGGGSIWFDGMRFEDNPLQNDNLLVARSVLLTPKVVDTTINTDIEYSLGINIT
jgi:hypothetical protein